MKFKGLMYTNVKMTVRTQLCDHAINHIVLCTIFAALLKEACAIEARIGLADFELPKVQSKF